LTQPHRPKSAPAPNTRIQILTPHFLVNPVKDAWAYDEDEVDDLTLGMDSSEGASEEGGSLVKRSRLSVLDPANVRDKKSRDGGVERKGNITKVGLNVELLSDASGPVEVGLSGKTTGSLNCFYSLTSKSGTHIGRKSFCHLGKKQRRAPRRKGPQRRIIRRSLSGSGWT